ncbi:MAG: hypothetical protein WB795_12000 [Candidatus Acidiferrales bacterium]
MKSTPWGTRFAQYPIGDKFASDTFYAPPPVPNYRSGETNHKSSY